MDRQLISSGSLRGIRWVQPRGPRRRPDRRLRDGAHLADGSCDPDVTVQARRCLEIMLAALAEGGASPEHVVRTRMYLVAAASWEAVSRVHGEIFGTIRPATTLVIVAALVDPRWRLEIEAEAIRPPS